MSIEFQRDTCDYCEKAKTVPYWPLYRAQCKGCAIRSLASSPSFHQSSVDGALTPAYRDALGVIFGDGWRAGHALVKAQHERIRALILARAKESLA